MVSHRRLGPRAAGAVLAVLALLALSGCGRFVRSDSAAPTTTEPADQEVGSGITVSTTSTTAAPAGGTKPTGGPGGTAAPATAPPDPACPPPPANASQTTHAPSGFSVSIAVQDRTCYGAREPFFMSLTVKNTTSEDRFMDPNQSEYFEITGNGKRWTDRSCLPKQEETEAPPAELGPGREAIFDARYPIPQQSDRDPDQCMVPRGTYQVVGILEWCPPSANSDGFCSPAESQPIRTPPVRIRIG